MKTIGKLNINPEKALKNDELKNLKGGYYYTFECWVFDTPYGNQVDKLDMSSTDEHYSVVEGQCANFYSSVYPSANCLCDFTGMY